jgi:uroporphyrinogen III methyltransferase/synthase
LERAGAQAVIAPTIRIVPADDRAGAERAVAQAPQFAWIVFTSANGVRAFFDILDERREDARFLGQTKIAAIGRVTSGALRDRGVYADLVPQSFVAESLAQALVLATKPGEKILIFRAQEARDVLAAELVEQKREPVVVAAYKTVFTEDPQFAEKAGSCDILTFTSASTVRGFVHLLQGKERAAALAAGKVVACIGPITEQEARTSGLRVTVTAGEFTTDGLLQALVEI